MITLIEHNGWVDFEVIEGRMDPKEKKVWTDALRSGKYKQGRARLKRRAPHEKSTFCCLGVRCDMLNIQITGAYGYISKDAKHGEKHYYYEGNMSYLPENALIKLDNGRTFDGSEPFFSGSRFYSLAALNDSGLTFDQIADIIDFFL